MRNRKTLACLVIVLLILVTFALLRQPDTMPAALTVFIDRVAREWHRLLL
jgi:hypothetical protein